MTVTLYDKKWILQVSLSSDLEMGRLSRMIWVPAKCNRVHPCKRETEEHYVTPRGGGHVEMGQRFEDAGLEDWSDEPRATQDPPGAGRGRGQILSGASGGAAAL